MAKETKITLEGLVVSSLAMTDALAKLMIAKGVITEGEFNAQLARSGRICGRPEAPTLTIYDPKRI